MDWKFGAASDPNASSEILESLFQDKEYWLRLAKNPSTPRHALQKLSYVSTYEDNEVELMTNIFGYLIKNPSSTADAIVRVLDWVEENQIPTRIAFNAIKPIDQVEKDIETIKEVIKEFDLKHHSHQH